MRSIALMYHDIISPGVPDESGFPGGDAALYKLVDTDFARHLAAMGEVLSDRAITTVTDPDPPDSSSKCVFLTFDDGGSSAYDRIAGMLESRNWRGHFFITAGRVGSRGFVTRAQLRELHARGHVIGSHSWSHPMRMSRCSRGQLEDEWERSVHALTEILGEPISVASVPGGHYSRAVAETAASVGITALFTSEPITGCSTVEGCTIYGRFTVQRWTSAGTVAALVQGHRVPQLRQWLLWNSKKAAKYIGGSVYLKWRLAMVGSKHR